MSLEATLGIMGLMYPQETPDAADLAILMGLEGQDGMNQLIRGNIAKKIILISKLAHFTIPCDQEHLDDGQCTCLQRHTDDLVKTFGGAFKEQFDLDIEDFREPGQYPDLIKFQDHLGLDDEGLLRYMNESITAFQFVLLMLMFSMTPDPDYQED